MTQSILSSLFCYIVGLYSTATTIYFKVESFWRKVKACEASKVALAILL